MSRIVNKSLTEIAITTIYSLQNLCRKYFCHQLLDFVCSGLPVLCRQNYAQMMSEYSPEKTHALIHSISFRSESTVAFMYQII